MLPFTTVESRAVPLLRDNIDTDAIIPSREIKEVTKVGLAGGLFAGWRYLEIGGRVPNPAFVLNDPAFVGAKILLGGNNFGCGSSREHAVWALGEFGFRAVIAPSFSPIFRSNCVSNGLLPVELDPTPFAWENGVVKIDLPLQTVSVASQQWTFDFDSNEKAMLVHGLDAIDATLRRSEEIETFRAVDRRRRPWAYL
ncbi:MAG TPA: 3-isopropylmalate dehydratase small subunit [Steroidobacteraceae bacterium]|jgi:3-isopropylmalate/(R)-2-methylmalate dehydratase small subunit